MKNKMSIEFEVENAAFFDEDGNFEPGEVSRILVDIAKHVRNGSDGRNIHDINGNRIGKWSLDVPDNDD